MTHDIKQALDALEALRDSIPEHYVQNDVDDWMQTIRQALEAQAQPTQCGEGFSIVFEFPLRCDGITELRATRDVAEVYGIIKDKNQLLARLNIPKAQTQDVNVEALKAVCSDNGIAAYGVARKQGWDACIDYLHKRGMLKGVK